MDIIISKHVVYELLTAVKKGLQAKTDLMSRTKSGCLGFTFVYTGRHSFVFKYK